MTKLKKVGMSIIPSLTIGRNNQNYSLILEHESKTYLEIIAEHIKSLEDDFRSRTILKGNEL